MLIHHSQFTPKPTYRQEAAATYSERGESLALRGLDGYDKHRHNPEKASDHLNLYFQEIGTNPETSSFEKEVATLGKRLSLYNDSDSRVVARTQRAALGAIAASVPGPAGQVLAQIGLNLVGQSASDYGTGRVVAREALRALAVSDSTSSRQKDMAALGMEFGASRMPSSEAMALRRTVLNDIAKNTDASLSTPAALARSTGRAVTLNRFSSWKTINTTLTTGLQEIQVNPESSGRERSLAEHGLTLGHKFTDRAATIIREAFLVELTKGTAESATTSLARAALNTADSELSTTSKRFVMDSIFSQVVSDPAATESQREFARYALQNADRDPLYADSVRKQYMQWVVSAG